jgi:glycosyltransferase involved in cell wall biosynthesis
MAESILISICIPAYKRTDYLQRLLDSVAAQTFTDFEVVLSDDSPDDSVRQMSTQYQNRFPISYHRNSTPLGTPENWNQAVRMARGEWIKLMHDDDWFADAQSLQVFVDLLQAHPGSVFFFSAYANIELALNRTEKVLASSFRLKKLYQNPATLFAKNVIGPPSAVLYKKNNRIEYDNELKWLVDIDFYIRYLSSAKPVYTSQVLVNIGISDSQVTKESFRNKNIEIPESLLLLNKLGANSFRNILVFDAMWRLMRNLGIRDGGEISKSGYSGEIPSQVFAIINFQKKIPQGFLRNGFGSKLLMMICYLFA